MANLKTITKKEEEDKKKKKKKKKTKKNDVAYTPLTEAQKEKERKKLIEDLKKGKKGLYHSPGGTRYHVKGTGKTKKEVEKLLAKKLEKKGKTA